MVYKPIIENQLSDKKNYLYQMWCSDLFNNLMIPFESLTMLGVKDNASMFDFYLIEI